MKKKTFFLIPDSRTLYGLKVVPESVFRAWARRLAQKVVKGVQELGGPEMVMAKSKVRLSKLRELKAPSLLILNEEIRIMQMEVFKNEGEEAFLMLLMAPMFGQYQIDESEVPNRLREEKNWQSGRGKIEDWLLQVYREGLVSG